MTPRRLTWLAALALAVSCGAPDAGGDGAPAVEEPAPSDVSAEPTKKAARYSANIYGMCRKYTDCGCNTFGSVVDCREAFGKSADKFPPKVYTCVLARSCDSLCVESPGVCFDLYAMEKSMEKELEGVVMTQCPAGTTELHHFDINGRYLDTECR